MMDSAFQELMGEFLLEARERVGEVESLMLSLTSAAPEEARSSLAQIKRELHTLKGNSGMMGFSGLQQLAHQLEDLVQDLDLSEPRIDPMLILLDQMRTDLASLSPDAPTGKKEESEEDDESDPAEAGPQNFREGSVRVPFARIDQLVELLAETVIFRNRLSDAVQRGLHTARYGEGDPATLLEAHEAAWDDVEGAFEALGKTLNMLQEQVTELGMVPLQGLFRSLGRIVHDESARAGKQVELVVAGGETPIDKTLLEAAGTALGHLVRNAIIHGIEAPEQRSRLRKNPIGTLHLSAALETTQVMIEVRDDGGGIDLEVVRNKAKEAGLSITQTEADVELLFEEGFSTRSGADLSSGRGVGLSAVRKAVERHNGRIEIHNRQGLGCSFSLRLPVTASISRSLLIRVDNEEYALPLTAIVETLQIDDVILHEVNHLFVVRWRGQLIPLLDLGRTFGTTRVDRTSGYAILIKVNQRLRALAIDDLIGIHDIVIKGLDGIVGQPPGISGSTILGDGRVIMILDPASLATLPLERRDLSIKETG